MSPSFPFLLSFLPHIPPILQTGYPIILLHCSILRSTCYTLPLLYPILQSRCSVILLRCSIVPFFRSISLCRRSIPSSFYGLPLLHSIPPLLRHIRVPFLSPHFQI